MPVSGGWMQHLNDATTLDNHMDDGRPMVDEIQTPFPTNPWKLLDTGKVIDATSYTKDIYNSS